MKNIFALISVAVVAVLFSFTSVSVAATDSATLKAAAAELNAVDAELKKAEADLVILETVRDESKAVYNTTRTEEAANAYEEAAKAYSVQLVKVTAMQKELETQSSKYSKLHSDADVQSFSDGIGQFCVNLLFYAIALGLVHWVGSFADPTIGIIIAAATAICGLAFVWGAISNEQYILATIQLVALGVAAYVHFTKTLAYT